MKRSIGILFMALATSMVFAGVAVANDDVETSVAAVEPVVVVDEETGTISIALPVDGELPECPPEEGEGGDDGEGPIQTDDEVDGEEGAEGEEGDEGDEGGDETVTYGPGDCIELVMEHPSGKTHHGAVVSTAAKALHPSMLDGIKKGEIMRWVAKSGKSGDDGDDGEDGDDGDDGDDGEKPEKGTKPEKGDDHPSNGKNKRDKATKDDASDRGNRRADHPGKGKGRNG